MVRTPSLRVSLSWTEMSLSVELVGSLVSFLFGHSQNEDGRVLKNQGLIDS